MLTYSVFGNAAPESSETPKQISTDPVLKKGELDKSTSTLEDSMILTPTEAPPAELGEDPLLPTRRLAYEANFVGGGLWMGSIRAFEVNDNLLFMTIGQSTYDEAQRAREWTFEFTSNAMFGGSYGMKWLQSLRSYYEPYLKVSLGGLFSTGESFGTFINWKRYQVRGAIGADDLFSLGRRVRCEASLIYSGFGISLSISGSYAF